MSARFLVMDAMLAGVLIGLSRTKARIVREWGYRRQKPNSRRVLIVGAGDAGAQVARALASEADSGYVAVGFVDDDATKTGTVINRVMVYGTRNDIPRLSLPLGVKEIWIAMPSAPGKAVQDTVRIAREAGIRKVKVVPGFSALMSGEVKLTDLRDVRIEELLGRDPVRIDTASVSSFIEGKTVLVTGAAGSIGSEFCRQVASFNCGLMVVFDQDETGVFNLTRALQAENPALAIEPVVGDVRDAAKINSVFRRHRPHVVFHAAAYKHVPLMEENPDEAIKTNVFGTRNVAAAAKEWGAQKFVLVSTDKAVNPTSIMGATKRAAEVLIRTMGQSGPVSFVAVRFGNVLGSRGSVVPVFQEQIARGGPVTVTDPDMRRYFMTIPEAVLLVLQAGAIGENGQVLVLDMGEPVKILELARQVIRLSGLEPEDIPIVFTGMRPGEKLFEDILTAEEGTSATNHDRIFTARINDSMTQKHLRRHLAEMERAVASGDDARLISALKVIVPTYQHKIAGPSVHVVTPEPALVQ
jgi:FlaA1/EpsC-like NDP-sugar epimerase